MHQICIDIYVYIIYIRIYFRGGHERVAYYGGADMAATDRKTFIVNKSLELNGDVNDSKEW